MDRFSLVLNKKPEVIRTSAKKRKAKLKEAPGNVRYVTKKYTDKEREHAVAIVKASEWWAGVVGNFNPAVRSTDYVVCYWRELSNGVDVAQEGKTTLAIFRTYIDASFFFHEIKNRNWGDWQRGKLLYRSESNV